MLQDLRDLLDNSFSPYHATTQMKKRLLDADFIELQLENSWQNSLKANNAYFIVLQGSSIISFYIPQKIDFDKMVIIGAHTDSPALKLKTQKPYIKESSLMLGVEVYGGALLHTWFDRDLKIAGRVSFENKEGIQSSLVNLPLLCRVPNLAIHLNRDIQTKGFIIDKQTQLPVLVGDKTNSLEVLTSQISEQLKIKDDDILAIDLFLYDNQRSELGGGNNNVDFLHSGKLDNLAMCHAGITSLINAKQRKARNFVMTAFFDHEEVGSQSSSGGDSVFLNELMRRVYENLNLSNEKLQQVKSKSLFLSADMAHATHPNYSDKHDHNHKVYLNQGPVIKINANQRYATNSQSAAQIELIARKQKITLQKYINHTSLSCGSTIGPLISSQLAIETIDLGNPMLSMHSIREMCGAKDHEKMINLMTATLLDF